MVSLQEMATEFYSEGGYLEKHPNWHAEDAPWKAGNIFKILSSNQIKPKTICEIGCGTGEILVTLDKLFNHSVALHGYEISPQAFDIASAKANDQLKFFLQSLDKIPNNKSYDVGLMIDVFEHVEDFYGFIREARTKSRHMVFHIPLDLSVQSVWRGKPLMNKRKNSGHIHYFTKETALAALRDTGYKVIDYFYTGSYIDLPARTIRSKVARIPRRLLFAMNHDLGARILGGYSLMVLAE